MDEHEPVDESEFVYRRIPRMYYTNLEMPVQREAFRPTKNDATGVSVLRARFAQPAETLAHVDPSKVNDYFVARLAVRDLVNLGLTVVPEPTAGGPPGHAVIPELNWQAYQGKKEHWKPILVELAKLAGADIVHKPA
jgi:hypothetical protein